jgi:hypothetical protein
MYESDGNGVAEAVVESAAEKPRGRRSTGRSPSYPFFDLERSLARASQLSERERNHATPVMTALKHWGYTNASGKAGMTLSALKQFGLLEDVGRGDTRRVQLTTRAYDILHTPHESEREQLLREAALAPDIHRALWEEFGTSLPSDSSLAWTLTKERGFTPTGADDFIRQWKRTMEFARLGDAPHLEPGESEEPQPIEPQSIGESTLSELRKQPDYERKIARGAALVDEVMSRPTPATQATSPGIQQYPIPIALSGRPPVVIAGAFPLSETEWTQFMAVLSAMKPVLVGELATPVQNADQDGLD